MDKADKHADEKIDNEATHLDKERHKGDQHLEKELTKDLQTFKGPAN
ncbi:hypothetical protein [Pseudomonas violetae]|jgi:DNA repair ATPase RecN|uniref:Uncharacterized protein n=1 Tax=Pseudomonas violetae TaxID=2915813 RepID=A0ABT0F4C6_9PSED|nr:hypothetical protein [Pseudomonas violetae]MCK1792850.1 hypothetical protein [Pseudomonas violetae]